MSICTLATLAATATPADATTQAVGSSELILAAVFGAAALLVAYLAGAFDRLTVLGPIRLDEGDSPVRVLAITLLGIGMWIGLTGTYLALAHGQQIAEARQRNEAFELPTREAAIVNASAQLIAVAAVLIATHVGLRDGIRKLGLQARDVPRAVLAGLTGAFVAIPLTLSAAVLVQRLWLQLNFTRPEDHQLLQFMLGEPDRVARGIVFVSAVIVAPLFEETIFRGHVQTLVAHTIRRYRGLPRPFEPIELSDAPWIRWIAICTGALLFAIIHEAGWMMPPLFLLAVCFGYVYERTGRLWAPVLMHALFNATSIALALFTHR